MATLQIRLDPETHGKLVDSALAERRPVNWQAEVIIRRALGLPFPMTAPDPQPQRDLATVGASEPERAA